MLSRAFDHICMEKARYKFLIIIIIITYCHRNTRLGFVLTNAINALFLTLYVAVESTLVVFL